MVAGLGEQALGAEWVRERRGGAVLGDHPLPDHRADRQPLDPAARGTLGLKNPEKWFSRSMYGECIDQHG